MALLLAACESEKAPSFIKGNPYAKEFARLNGPVKSAVYSYYKNGKLDTSIQNDYSTEGVLLKSKTLVKGDSIVIHYTYDPYNNIQDMNGTGITDYRAEYKKGTLVKEWLYSDKKKKNGITNRYKIKGETLIKKVNDIRTGAGTTYTYSYNSRGLVKAVETMVNGTLQPEMTEQSCRERILQRDAGDYEKEDVWYRWKVCIPWEMLKERSERKCPQLGAFTGLSIQGRNPGGGVKTLEIQGENQNATLENEYAIRKFLSVKGLSVSRNDGSVCDTMELLPSACFIVDFRKEQGAGTFVFTGGGYGHGVGMSQNGAKHLAENGLGWRDILQIFYQNITIENLQEF